MASSFIAPVKDTY